MENTTYHNLWDTSKAVLGGKSTAVNAYIRNEKKNSEKSEYSIHAKKWVKNIKPKENKK